MSDRTELHFNESLGSGLGNTMMHCNAACVWEMYLQTCFQSNGESFILFSMRASCVSSIWTDTCNSVVNMCTRVGVCGSSLDLTWVHLPEVTEVAAARRLLWSWLEVFAASWVEQSLLRNVSIPSSSVWQKNANLSPTVGKRRFSSVWSNNWLYVNLLDLLCCCINVRGAFYWCSCSRWS